jgi:fatty acid/phospholipid biosynthesis enzyme
MGGDNAPAQVLLGASQAAAAYKIDIAVVGLPSTVQPLLDQHPLLRLVPCTQVVSMDDHPAQAVRSKPDSSMNVCARMCKDGKADGWVSAGNSGAIMATALFVQGRIRGVERPALGSIVPTQTGVAYFLDVGANVDSKADVIVADGFVGNIAIKMAEATADFLFRNLREEIPKTTRGKLGGLLIRGGVRKLRDRIDWREFGGAPLLGIDGVAVVAHGRSDARAIKNAIRVAKEAVENQLVSKIRAEVGK